MIPGTGTITDYGNFSNNCVAGQMPYKIPVNSISDIQLFIDIGTTKPTTVLYELIHTCGMLAGTVDTLATTSYVIGQNKNNRWYGVFKDFTGATQPLNCFVIAITLDSNIYFSDEYCVEQCNDAVAIEGCYGNLDAKLSTDCNGIYFGFHAGEDDPLGDTRVRYKHKVFLRDVDVTLDSYKNTFKQGITRTFRTESEKIFKMWAEIIPEWYFSSVAAVLRRGEVNINGTRYLLNATEFEKVDECMKQWSPASTFKESCFQSFSCEADPCADPPESCCDPVVISVTVDTIADESQSSANPPPPGIYEAPVIIEAVVDGVVVVSGTTDPVSGIVNGSTTITCNAFAGVRVFVVRGGLPLPGIDPGGGQAHYIKALANNFITLVNGPLVSGETIYIETIPL